MSRGAKGTPWIAAIGLSLSCGAVPEAPVATPKPKSVPTAAAAVQLPPVPRAPVGVVPSGPPPRAVSEMMAGVDSARIRRYVDTLAAFGTRHTLSDTSSNERGIGAARRWIKSELDVAAEATGLKGRKRRMKPTMTVAFDSHKLRPDGRRINRTIDIVNVVAVLPGTLKGAKKRRYYVMGHYDSRASDVMDATADAPGANDDASGVAVVIELARVMSKHQHDATLVFMATAGEEQGLYGARLHAQAAKKNKLDIRAVLNNDIVGDPTGAAGRMHADRVRVFSDGLPGAFDEKRFGGVRRLASSSDSGSRQLARFVSMVGSWHATPVQPMLVFRRDRFLRGGDHTAFDDIGVAAVRFSEVEENYDRQHQDLRSEGDRVYGDLPEHVNVDYLANVARLNLATIAHLANAPSVPPNARIIVASLANDTTLRWKRSPEPDVAGYEVVWRETTSPVWQHAKDVGKDTEATLPLSKDNWFFGVRAYDETGYRSPVAFPTVGRK